ncbi:type II toxin-antitoxin system VapC family toxin [Rhizobium sp. GCM10022189]|uniref:type II toxin-antitoxin system VapC family toxin n=1 Tax=Rhizobium sp. GCM10022189 TaxID=3252654 RepID=UPI00360C90D6
MAKSVLLLDTNIISLMGKQKSPAGLRPWLLEIGIDRLGICFPVITELLRGAHLKEQENPGKAQAIVAWVDQILNTNFPLLAMTPTIASIYARMTAVPALRHMWTVQRKEKHNRLGHDLMISAVSIFYQSPIITNNVDDFLKITERFPLPGVYDPFSECWWVRPPFEIPLPSYDRKAADPTALMLPTL